MHWRVLPSGRGGGEGGKERERGREEGREGEREFRVLSGIIPQIYQSVTSEYSVASS